jgi:hypothetical protein
MCEHSCEKCVRSLSHRSMGNCIVIVVQFLSELGERSN